MKLKHFEKFADTTEALAAATAAVEGKVSKTLKKTLKKLVDEDVQNQLLVADAKLGSAIKDKLSLQCVSNTGVQELMRCIRSQSESLLAGLPKKEMTAMALGLAHSLSRYKLKFSPDKIDTMIVQAQCLLDDLDKELNNYMMRAREWWVDIQELPSRFFHMMINTSIMDPYNLLMESLLDLMKPLLKPNKLDTILNEGFVLQVRMAFPRTR